MTAQNIPITELISLLQDIADRGYEYVHVHFNSPTDLSLQPARPTKNYYLGKPSPPPDEGDVDLTQIA